MTCGVQRLFLSSSSTIIAKPRHITTVLYLRPSLAWTKRFFSVAGNSDEAKSKPDELEKIADVSDGAFYVVRKGDAIGVYKNFADCQDQVCKSSTVFDYPVGIYKGFSLHKKTEEYLSSRGLKNALYSINAKDCKEGLFGTLAPCPFQEPNTDMFSCEKLSELPSSKMGLNRVGEISEVQGLPGSSLDSADLPKKKQKQTKSSASKTSISKDLSCIVEFDGASKGNPGQAGAGAILRTKDGRIVSQLREGLGVVTNNVAEYKALILGMKYALRNGFKDVNVQGDSKLVCMQIQDKWKAKHHILSGLCADAKQLKKEFSSFNICCVERKFNSDADAQANLAIDLQCGEVHEQCLKVSETKKIHGGN